MGTKAVELGKSSNLSHKTPLETRVKENLTRGNPVQTWGRSSGSAADLRQTTSCVRVSANDCAIGHGLGLSHCRAQ